MSETIHIVTYISQDEYYRNTQVLYADEDLAECFHFCLMYNPKYELLVNEETSVTGNFLHIGTINKAQKMCEVIGVDEARKKRIDNEILELDLEIARLKSERN